jgi:hypothetical protein
MKRSIWLVAVVLASAISLCADDMGKATDMGGWLCNAQCVKQDAGHAACDQKCTDKSGDIVLVDDHGKVYQIANQDKVMPHVGKKVKMKCKPMKDKKDTMFVDSIYFGG